MTDIDAERQKLLDTVRAFVKLAGEIGFLDASRQYFTEDAVLLAANLAPVKGREKIRAFLDPLGSFKITWEPFYVDMAASGDLAYTLGSWQVHDTDDDGKPIVHPGNYVTIWRKQPDGEWRCVFDTGHPGPPPA